MTPLLEVALANAVLALPLAVFAVAVSWFRRPAVTHALWLLVLLRLFMPPIWRVPVPEWPVERAAAVDCDRPVIATLATDSLEVAHPESSTGVESQTRPSKTPGVPPEDIANGSPPRFSWPMVIGLVWLTGTGVVLGLAVSRGMAFHRLLCNTDPAPAAWQRTCDRLAHRLGLRRAPGLWLVKGPVSPLLWAGFGRPRILLPADLAARLDGGRRAALLAHELAHLRRGDHLVRWLELAATAAFWWHPIVWVARRGLREAEEQCCDAWVVWALPAARRAYADALVDTVDFLSSACPALPPLASGLGTVRHLKRRVVMIMQGKVSRRMSAPGLLTGLALGAMLLAITPSWSQDSPRRDQNEDRKPPEPRPRTDARDDDPRRATEADDLRRQIRQLHDKLTEAQRRLATIEGPPASPRGGLPREEARRADPTDPLTLPGNSALEEKILELRMLRTNLIGGGTGEKHPQVKQIDNQIAEIEKALGKPRDPTYRRNPPRPPEPPAAPVAPIAPIATDPLASDRRIRDLEKELAELRRDIAEMRREMRGVPSRDITPPRPPEP
jgi:beta-lactamase regulating signal transducer with metallopeptidase domain